MQIESIDTVAQHRYAMQQQVGVLLRVLSAGLGNSKWADSYECYLLASATASGRTLTSAICWPRRQQVGGLSRVLSAGLSNSKWAYSHECYLLASATASGRPLTSAICWPRQQQVGGLSRELSAGLGNSTVCSKVNAMLA